MTKNLTLLENFAKGNRKETQTKSSTLNAVIYTRVSSKIQLDNLSLETQLKGCTEFAKRFGYNICGQFGGTYESAQSDERKELVRMMNFAKKTKEKISIILVYSLERFSRTGDNAIWLSRELRQHGITIVSVTQPIDTSNPSGVLQQNILFLFSQYDNDLRRQKCVAGMKEKLLKGEWLGMPPMGYKYVHSRFDKEVQRIEIDKKNGPLMRKAFQMKLEGATNTKISEVITAAGLRLTEKRLSDALRNPFYCGFLSHNLLDGELVKGKHPALISEKTFLKVNDLLKKNPHGFYHSPENENLPLRRFIRCSDCGAQFTGYLYKKKLKNGKVLPFHYYKCYTKGCKCNKSVSIIHGQWIDLIKPLQIDASKKVLIREQLELMWDKYYQTDIEEQSTMKGKLTELNEKLEKVDDRFAVGEIDRPLYEKTKAKLMAEIAPIAEALNTSQISTSCLPELFDKGVEMASNLSEYWLSATYEERVTLQNILFPEGIVYDRKNNLLRASRVNEAIRLISEISNDLNNKKGDYSAFEYAVSPSVVRRGIEPLLPE